MNLPSIKSIKAARWIPAPESGFTMVEMMVSTAIMIITVGALLSSHLIGLRQSQLVESKAGASDTSRRAIGQMTRDIRSAKMWFIGAISGTNFVAITNGLQRGTALALCETTNGSQFVFYYYDLTYTNNSNGRLMTTTTTNWNPVVLASNLIYGASNSLCFTAENYNGVNQSSGWSSKNYKNVIHTTLQFQQFQYPTTTVGSNCLYDFYQLDYRATPHLPE